MNVIPASHLKSVSKLFGTKPEFKPPNLAFVAVFQVQGRFIQIGQSSVPDRQPAHLVLLDDLGAFVIDRELTVSDSPGA